MTENLAESASAMISDALVPLGFRPLSRVTWGRVRGDLTWCIGSGLFRARGAWELSSGSASLILPCVRAIWTSQKLDSRSGTIGKTTLSLVGLTELIGRPIEDQAQLAAAMQRRASYLPWLGMADTSG